MSDESKWADAVASATVHVKEREEAAREAEELAKPRSSRLRGVVLSVILAVVVAWDVYTLTRPPEVLPPAEQTADLAWLVADAVELIESARGPGDELPSPTELADVLDEGVTFRPRDGGYTVVARSGETELEYVSRVPIGEWMGSLGLDPVTVDGDR